MSGLEATRDHARKKAAVGAHAGGCYIRQSNRWGQVTLEPAKDCAGCMTDSERALWKQIADEIDAYLAPGDNGPDLFGEVP